MATELLRFPFHVSPCVPALLSTITMDVKFEILSKALVILFRKKTKVADLLRVELLI